MSSKMGDFLYPLGTAAMAWTGGVPFFDGFRFPSSGLMGHAGPPTFCPQNV